MAVVLLFIVVLLALAGFNIHDIMEKEKKSWIKYLTILILIYIALVIFIGSGSLSAYLPYWLTGSDLWTVILVIFILAIVFWWVGGEGEGGEGEKPEGSGRAPGAPASPPT
jgi:polyferredoxin